MGGWASAAGVWLKTRGRSPHPTTPLNVVKFNLSGLISTSAPPPVADASGRGGIGNPQRTVVDVGTVSRFLGGEGLDQRLLQVTGVQLGLHDDLVLVRVGVRVAEVGHRDGRGASVGVGCVQVAGVSAWRLDIRICELLLLRMDSCVPPLTPLLASEGCRCFMSTAKYLFTVQLRHFLLISDCTLRDILHKVIINGPRWKDTSSPPS